MSDEPEAINTLTSEIEEAFLELAKKPLRELVTNTEFPKGNNQEVDYLLGRFLGYYRLHKFSLRPIIYQRLREQIAKYLKDLSY